MKSGLFPCGFVFLATRREQKEKLMKERKKKIGMKNNMKNETKRK